MIIKIIILIGTLLGIIIFIISIIKWKKIRREFEEASNDELVQMEYGNYLFFE